MISTPDSRTNARVITLLLLIVLWGCASESAPDESAPNQDAQSENPRKATAPPMTDQWQFFPCSMGDDQAFIFLDTGIAESIDQAPSSLAKIRVTYKSPREDGLPTDEEFEPVGEIENRIEAQAAEHGDCYVGRVTVSGYRIFYVYTARDEETWMRVVSELAADSGYSIGLAFTEDPEHAGYREDLYPTADDWQVIKDLQVLESLESHGDDGSKPRKVDHWIYFESEVASTDFVAWAVADRFTHDPELSGMNEKGQYCVRLTHHGSVRIGEISSHTIALRRKAEEHGGDYDGWETAVLAPE